MYEWIMNYLTGQTICEINRQKLELLIIEIGVPQGSLNGPYISTIYVNDFPGSPPIGHIHVEDAVIGLNVTLENFYLWCRMDRLMIHTGKTGP